MSKLEEELGWLKVLFGAAVAIDVSLIAWLAQNYSTADRGILVAGVIVVAGLTSAAVLIARAVYRQLDQLEKL